MKNQTVIIDIAEGSFDRGFRVNLWLREEGKLSPIASEQLPPDLDIPRLYERWEKSYLSLGKAWMIRCADTQIQNVSMFDDCLQLQDQLESRLNLWLSQRASQKLAGRLVQRVQPPAQFILKTHDPLLQRLPWHRWHWLEEFYPYAEIVLAADDRPAQPQRFTSPVAILAVLGNIDRLEAIPNLDQLHELPGRPLIKTLYQPSVREFQTMLFSRSWDMLFFVGHSFSNDDSGVLDLSPTVSLSLNELHNTLNHAVRKGLKLAVFNSCKGLGFAKYLANLKIPYTIVMREPVPDLVAAEFLKDFLTAFSQPGTSLHDAVSAARHQLNDLRDEKGQRYPGACWLPVISQNPDAPTLYWPKPTNWKGSAPKMIGAAIGVGVCLFLAGQVWERHNLRSHLSRGERLLVTSISNPDKIAGVNAMAAWPFPNHKAAVQHFEKALQQTPNDPESRIYLNNAKVGNRPFVTIAVGVPIQRDATQGLPEIAEEILRGIAQLQTEVNAQGGIGDRLLKVEIANDGISQPLVRKIAKHWVETPDVMAVIGHNSSDISIEAAEVYQRGKLVMMVNTSQSRLLTKRPTNEPNEKNYIFRSMFHIGNLLRSVMAHAKAQGKKNIAYCIDRDGYETNGKTVNDYLNEVQTSIYEIDGKPIEINCDLASPQFRDRPQESANAVIQDALNKGADSLFIAPRIYRLNPAFEIARQTRGRLLLLSNPAMLTTVGLANPRFFDPVMIPTPWFPGVFPNNPFFTQAKQLWQDTESITWRTATTYDAGKVIVEGLKRGGLSRNNLQQTLSDPLFVINHGATGTVKLTRSGDRLGSSLVVTLHSDKTRKTGQRIEPLTADLPSLGDRIFFTDIALTEKQAGAMAFAKEDFDGAIAAWTKARDLSSRTQEGIDPETLIYLNNAKAAKQGNFFRVGTSLPIGTRPEIAQEMLRGIAQAQDTINQAGGINGKWLQVAIANDNNQAKAAQEVARMFLNDPQVLAVVGSNASPASVAGATVYNDGKMVIISPTSFATDIRGDYTFRMIPMISAIADSLARHVVRTKPDAKIAFCYDGKSNDNVLYRDQFVAPFEAQGGKFVAFECDLSADNFNAEKLVNSIIRKGANSILLTPHIERMHRAVQIAQANRGRLQLYGSPSLYAQQTMNRNTLNLITAVPWHPTSIPNSAFPKQAKTLWKHSALWRSAMTYDSIQAIARALQKNPTREGIKTVLSSPNFSFEGASGTVQFLPGSNVRRMAPQLGSIVQFTRSSDTPSGVDVKPVQSAP